MKICPSITDKILFYNIFSSIFTATVDTLTATVDSKSTATATTSRLTMSKNYDHIRSGLVR